MPARRVPRSRSWTGIAQEAYALPSTCQLNRTAISDAAHTTGTDPDRCSFTTAVNTARDQANQAANVIADTAADLIGTIGRTAHARPAPPPQPPRR
ncbi:hypothetical protein ACWF95_40935 [Streptomyces vinaceus]